MARKSVLVTALGIGSAAAVLAARRLGRLLRSPAVRQAAAGRTAGTPGPQPAQAPNGTAAVATVTTADPAANLPARTWVVDNSADWDGNPGELVVLPRHRSPKDRGAK